jgi:hypothetical protein
MLTKPAFNPPVRIITSCYGPRFWLALTPWVKHIREFEDCPIDIVSLDGLRYDDIVSGVITVPVDSIGTTLQYGTGDRFRLERIIWHISQGVTCVQIDLDVIIKRSISILSDLPYDFIISRAFTFPPIAFKQFGFVACTGFYIAKPGACLLCKEILMRIESNSLNSQLDQYIINKILLELAEKGSWQQRSIMMCGLEFAMDEFDFNGCRIGVLPKNTILRSADTKASVFGNHAQPLLEIFFPHLSETADTRVG